MNETTKILQAFKDAMMTDLTPDELSEKLDHGMSDEWSQFAKSDLVFAWLKMVILPQIEWELIK